MKSGMGKLLIFIMGGIFAGVCGYHATGTFLRLYYRECIPLYGVPQHYRSGGVFSGGKKPGPVRGSNLRYAVRDGEKVRVGSVLAYRYSDALSADLAERRAEAQKELTMLQRVLAQLQSSNTPTVSDLTRNTDIEPAKAGGSGGTGALQRDGYPWR